MEPIDSTGPSRARWKEATPAISVVLGVLLFAAAVSRRPSTVFNPQFWAEDGALFYAQARTLGFLQTLVVPYSGYLNTLPRLAAGLSLLVPLSRAPLVFNLVALLNQSLPPMYLCSARMRNVGPPPVRILLAFLYVGVPNVPWVLGNLTNSQWHLAVLCFLIVVARPPKTAWGTAFDVTMLSIGAVTGPFALFLLPVALVIALVRRDLSAPLRAGILCAGAALLPLFVLGRPRATSFAKLGASVEGFCTIVTFQVIVPVLRGINTIQHYLNPPAFLALVSYTVAAAGFALLAYVVVRGSVEIRCFLLFAALVLAASLASPLAGVRETQWTVMQMPGAPSRYWLIPELAVAAAIVSLAFTASNRVMRAVGAALIGVMVVVDVAHWRLPDLPERHFAHYAAAFEALPVGAKMRIPTPPNWTFEITKTDRD